VAVLLYLRIRIVFARGVQRLAVDDSLRA